MTRNREPYAIVWIIAVLLTVLALCNRAHATCSPSTVGASGVCNATSGAQSPAQAQTQTNASNAAATTGPSTSTAITGPSTSSATGGAGGNSVSGSASRAAAGATSGSNSGVTLNSVSDYREAANVPNLGIIAPNGCGMGVQGGGSSRGGGAVGGIVWTTDECYAFILAQSYQSLGLRESACEVLGSTKAAERAVKRGARLPSCIPAVVVVTQYVERSTEGMYTREQVDAIVKKILRK